MGALHEGHGSLIAARERDHPTIVVSIFVNPLQFADREPTSTATPGTRRATWRSASELGVDLVWAPSVDEIYPPGVDPSLPTPARWGARSRVLRGPATSPACSPSCNGCST